MMEKIRFFRGLSVTIALKRRYLLNSLREIQEVFGGL
ncbi:hypothetical protein P608_09980 [Comamonas thiooxydans]|uniref:Uncharacterized protein n=1 Tax=Comamonas thiooxydans TaxID=363952 RepID=A0A0E3BVY0_9BURK|nr:hypothetical protein P608_09980 [Comamonas thiooxydans]KGH17169.1 hypothetical protein P607_18065 [Comamonas thiooxydans]